MEVKALNTFKDGFGFNVHTNEDPDLLTWLYDKWVKEGGRTPEQIEAVTNYSNFCKGVISQKPIIGMEYLDTGIGILLSTGERIPFNKSSTITAPTGSVSITGTTTAVSYSQGPAVQLGTATPITGGNS